MAIDIAKVKKVKRKTKAEQKASAETAVPKQSNVEVWDPTSEPSIPSLAVPEGYKDVGSGEDATKIEKIDYDALFQEGCTALVQQFESAQQEVDFPRLSFETCIKDFGDLDSDSFHESMDFFGQELHRRILQCGRKTTLNVSEVAKSLNNLRPVMVPGKFFFF